MLLSRLQSITVYVMSSGRADDGDRVDTLEKIYEGKGEIQYLASDELAMSAYGASLEKTYRFKSIYNDLEKFLLEKTNNSPDNLTKYLVEWKRS